MTGDHWLIGVVILQAGATGAYLYHGDLRQAVLWGGVAISNVAYLTLVRW
jgi:hypothetical protein